MTNYPIPFQRNLGSRDFLAKNVGGRSITKNVLYTGTFPPEINLKMIELATFLFKSNFRVTSVTSDEILAELVLFSKCWVRNALQN